MVAGFRNNNSLLLSAMSEIALDPLGHHALSCRRGGDVVLRHNQLRDVFVDICHKANLGVRIEAGSALTPDLSRSRPVDAL